MMQLALEVALHYNVHPSLRTREINEGDLVGHLVAAVAFNAVKWCHVQNRNQVVTILP